MVIADKELEGLEMDNTPEKNRQRVAEQRNIEGYESARRSLERTPIGSKLGSNIPTDQLPAITRADWKQNGNREAWLILSEEVLVLDGAEETEPSEKVLEEMEDVISNER